MVRAAYVSPVDIRFDDFLYAPVREEPGGMSLTVLSFLARLDVDPWEEAARFAQEPAEAATHRLAQLLGQLPESAPGESDAGATAARLIGLLPRVAATGAPQRAPRAGEPSAARERARGYAYMYLVALALMLVASWLFR